MKRALRHRASNDINNGLAMGKIKVQLLHVIALNYFNGCYFAGGSTSVFKTKQ